jgi:IclR family KDG regulon transcriptional repressor
VLKNLNQVLSLFSRERPELSVLDAAALLHRPRSTVYRLMAQMEHEKFLDRDEETGRYRLGIRLAALGELALRSTSLQWLAHPVLRRLSRQTGETATLLLLRDGEGVAVLHVESSQRVAAKGVLGRHWPLHASAGGKTLLAWLPEKEQRRLLKRSLKGYTPTTITSLETLRRELRNIRERGYATVRGEYMDDVWGLAAPIFNHHERVDAAITVGGPRSRVTQDRFPELGKVLIVACAHMSRTLGYLGAYPRKELASGGSEAADRDGAVSTTRLAADGKRARKTAQGKRS